MMYLISLTKSQMKQVQWQMYQLHQD
jgi:hypothetical protein